MNKATQMLVDLFKNIPNASELYKKALEEANEESQDESK